MKLLGNMLSMKMFLILSLLVSQSFTKWCWTKSQVNNPSFRRDKSSGDFNYGTCDEAGSSNVTIEYTAKVTTSHAENSTTNKKILIKLEGSKGSFDSWATLASNGFSQKGIPESSDPFFGKDVGQITSISLKLVDERMEGSRYKCSKIVINKSNVDYHFDCLNPIEPNGPIVTITESGIYPYQIEVKTGDFENDATNGPVHIILFGSKTTTSEKILSDSPLLKGSKHSTIINSQDIGEIIGFKLFLKGQGTWTPMSLTVKSILTSQNQHFELPDVHLQNPGRPSFEINLKSGDPSKEGAGNYSYGLDDESQIDADFQDWNNDYSSDLKKQKSKVESHLDINNPAGGFLEDHEKVKVLSLTCTQVLENTDKKLFGPDYTGKKCEYYNVLAKCPSNCHKETGTVFGVSIHPKNSPICLSAIVDKAIPEYGGLISISTFPGLDEYKVPHRIQKQIGRITIKGFEEGNSSKSFVVAKVDSIDLIEKDIRIVSWDGTLKNQGRIEFRNQGVWGTVCNLGNNPKSAELICKDMGYKDGKWISGDDDSSSVCNKFQSQDFCGAISSKIHFSNLECNDQNTTFSKCNKVIADLGKCDHSKDAIINCFNNNFQNASQIPDKTVRIGGQFDKEPSTGEVIGRLEIYYEGKWGPVCNHKFNSKTANVVCKSMNFQEGKNIFEPAGAGAGEVNFKKYQYEESSTIKSTATELVCDDSASTNILSCQGTFGKDVECSHALDVVISCTGNGDPSGSNQYQPIVNNSPPELGKLGMPAFEISCDTTGRDARFRGDPGSIFQVKCPEECFGSASTIVGTGVYSIESNVCASAIHSGALIPKKPGLVVLIKTHGLNDYIGSSSKGLNSLPNAGAWSPAFSFSSLNSSWKNSVKKWESDQQISKMSFMEFNLKVSPLKFFNKKASNLMSRVISRGISNSFLEFSLSAPRPVFSYIEKDLSHNFSQNDKYIFPGGSMSKLTKFTIYVSINMIDMRQYQDSVIFSYGGEDGFSLVIIESELYLGKLTDKKLTNLNVIVPVNIDFSFIITFDGESLNYSVKAGSYKKAYKDVKTSFETPSHGKVSVGRIPTDVSSMPASSVRPFNGKIYFVLVFNDSLPFTMIKAINDFIKSSKKSADKPTIYTTDKIECMSTCMNTPAGSGPTPPEAQLNYEVLKDKNSANGCSNNGPSAMFEGVSQSIPDNSNQNDSNSSGDNFGSINDPGQGSSYNNSTGNDNSNGNSNSGSNNNYSGQSGSGNQGSGNGGNSSSSGEYNQNDNSDFGGLNINSNGNGLNSDSSGSNSGQDNTSSSNSGSSNNYSNQSQNRGSGNRLSNNQVSVGTSTNSKEQTTNLDTIVLEKDTALEYEAFANAYPGLYFRVLCHLIDLANQMPVYGTAIYRADSSICFAAIHFGKLSIGTVQELIIKIGNIQEGYNGSEGSLGVKSLDGFGEKKLSFTIEPAKDLKGVACMDSVRSTYPNSVFGETYLISCLEDCSDSSAKIYGGNKNPAKDSSAALSDDSGNHCIYSEDSSICKAALHCGVINKFNRNVKFQITGGQSNYESLQSFGISSEHKGESLRSFSFVSQRIGVVTKFEENFNSDINKNWLIESCTGNECVNKASNIWEYYENESDFSNRLQQKKEIIKAIRHTGAISLNRSLSSATIIKKKFMDFSNGIFNFSILFKSMGPFYVYFRYLNDMNHIGIEFNNATSNNIVLFMKSQGSSIVLKNANLTISTRLWYFVEIDIINKDVVIKITPDTYNESLVNISAKVNDTSRGTIGFGCNNSNDFLINGISVKPYSKLSDSKNGNLQDNKFTWNKLVSTSQKTKQVKSYCDNNFRENAEERKKCTNPQFYCRYKCDSELPQVYYGILHLGCYKDCISAMVGAKPKQIVTTDPSINYRVGEVVDFFIQGSYIPATIKDIDQNQKDDVTYAKLDYSILGENRVDTFSLAQGLIFKCGTKLKNAICTN